MAGGDGAGIGIVGGEHLHDFLDGPAAGGVEYPLHRLLAHGSRVAQRDELSIISVTAGRVFHESVKPVVDNMRHRG